MTEKNVEVVAQRSLLRRYAGSVLLGSLLGIGLLYVLSRFAEPSDRPWTSAVEERRLADEAKLHALDPELVLTEPAESPAPDRAGNYLEPTPCPDAEDADCLLATLRSSWRVIVGSGSDGPKEPASVEVPIGDKLNWSVTSARAGLLTTFVVEQDGSVLLLYPNPAGEMPVLAAYVQQPVPRPADRAKMTWNRPGPRRALTLVSTTPFVAPEGLPVGNLATYYAAGDPAIGFFASLRNQVHQDQVGEVGEWAIGEVRFEVVEVVEERLRSRQ